MRAQGTIAALLPVPRPLAWVGCASSRRDGEGRAGASAASAQWGAARSGRCGRGVNASNELRAAGRGRKATAAVSRACTVGWARAGVLGAGACGVPGEGLGPRNRKQSDEFVVYVPLPLWRRARGRGSMSTHLWARATRMRSVCVPSSRASSGMRPSAGAAATALSESGSMHLTYHQPGLRVAGCPGWLVGAVRWQSCAMAIVVRRRLGSILEQGWDFRDFPLHFKA